jgi:acetylornithine deacetylase/succinyl-diaminopimelate desuccinylase-like protein
MASVTGPRALDPLADFLQALVRIPSINPPGGEGPVAVLVPDESVDRRDVATAASIYARLILDLLG